MKYLSFKKYYDNKELLERAGIQNVRAHIEYSITKYCKIPVVESYESEKTYLALKPKDTVKILWEYESDTPILRRLVIVSEGEKEFIPCWTSNKMYEWTGANCKQIKALV
jgi:hypothetical protein